MSYSNVLTIGNKYQELNKLLDFYEHEVGFFKNLLGEIIHKNTHQDVTAEGEHFQNQFIIQQKNIDDCRSLLSRNKHLAFLDAKEHAGKVDERIIVENRDIAHEIESLEQVMVDLRKDFIKYSIKWM